jgi:hypothetical protein
VNSNPTKDVVEIILRNDYAKETEKKYSVYNNEMRGTKPSL